MPADLPSSFLPRSLSPDVSSRRRLRTRGDETPAPAAPAPKEDAVSPPPAPAARAESTPSQPSPASTPPAAPEVPHKAERARRTIVDTPPVLSKEVFDSITEGMTYEQAAAAIGSPGIASGGADQTYRWRRDECTLVLRFSGGRLVRKAVLGSLPEEAALEGGGSAEGEGAPEPESVAEGEDVLEQGPGIADSTEEMVVAQTDPAIESAAEGEGEGEGEGEEVAADEFRAAPKRSEAASPAEAGEEEAPSRPAKRVFVVGEEPGASPAESSSRQVLVLGSQDAAASDDAEAEAGDAAPEKDTGRKRRARLPKYAHSIRSGDYRVRIENQGEAAVNLGVRSGKWGRDVTVSPGKSRTLSLDRGSYALYHIDEADPYTVHSGPSLRIDGETLSDAYVTVDGASCSIQPMGLDFIE